MIRKLSSSSSSFTSTITSTVASGSNFIKSTQGARLSLGSDSRYFSDNGTNLLCTGNFFPAASVTYDMGSNSAFWGTAYLHAVTLNSGQIRDSSSTARITVNNATGNIYAAEVADSGSAVAHDYDNTTTLSTSGAKLVRHKNNGTEKCFIDKDGQYENVVTGKGIILKSPDGTRYLITVANGGTVSVAAA